MPLLFGYFLLFFFSQDHRLGALTEGLDDIRDVQGWNFKYSKFWGEDLQSWNGWDGTAGIPKPLGPVSKNRIQRASWGNKNWEQESQREMIYCSCPTYAWFQVTANSCQPLNRKQLVRLSLPTWPSQISQEVIKLQLVEGLAVGPLVPLLPCPHLLFWLSEFLWKTQPADESLVWKGSSEALQQPFRHAAQPFGNPAWGGKARGPSSS